MDSIKAWWNGLPYYITGSVIRFVRITALAGLTAGGMLLINAITPQEALVSIQVAAGGALLAAVDKLRREWGIEQEALEQDSLTDGLPDEE
jgi:hypothetical protein